MAVHGLQRGHQEHEEPEVLLGRCAGVQQVLAVARVIRVRLAAGGLGQQMDNSMKMFQGSEVATILIVFMLLVGLADYVSARLRKVLA
jgi:hypothetical protein